MCAQTAQRTVQIINWLAAFKPKQLARRGVATSVATELCKITLEEDPPGHDSDVDAAAPRAFACHSLDTLALSLPSKNVLPVALEFLGTYGAAPAATGRVAALAVAACIVEGCVEGLRRGGGYVTIRDAALAALSDSDDDVRHSLASLPMATPCALARGHRWPQVATGDLCRPGGGATVASKHGTRATVAGCRCGERQLWRACSWGATCNRTLRTTLTPSCHPCSQP